MADNVTVDSGTGITVATDDIGGVAYQRVKISQGADGSATDVSSAAPLQVTLANTGANTTPVVVDLGANNDVTVTGSVTANAGTNLNTSLLALEAGGNLAGAATSLAVIDDWDETDRAKVNPIVGNAGVTGNTGTVDAGTQRVTLATNVALPAGSNAIGKLAANSGVDIGDVDVTSIAAGDNNIGNVDIVTVPSDPFGANADAASASGSISAKLRGIATALGITAFDLGSGTGGSRTLRLFQDTAQWVGGAGSVSSATQRVTHASNDPVTTSVQLIDDAIFTDDAGFTPATSKLMMVGAQLDDSSTDSVDEGDAGALRMTPDRRLYTAAKFVTVSTDVTRKAADTTQYSINDAISDDTASPTAGGFTFTSAASKSGGSGIITDAIITTANDAGTPIQCDIWLFNTSVTNINDNTAFAVSDSEIKTCVGKIPFALEDAGNNGFYHAQNLNIGFTCSGSANLRFLLRAKNTYTPVGSEVLTFVLKIMQMD